MPDTGASHATDQPDQTQSKERSRAMLLLRKINKESVYTFVSQHCSVLTPFDMRQALAPGETSAFAEEYLTRWAVRLEGVRNVLVVLPLTVTWLSLALAAVAYQQSVAAINGGAPPSFFQLWQQGFPALTTVRLGSINVSLVENHAHVFTFANVALADFFILGLLFVLTAIAQWISVRGHLKAIKLQRWLETELFTFSSRSHHWTPNVEAINMEGWDGVKQALLELYQSFGEINKVVIDFQTALEKEALAATNRAESAREVNVMAASLNGAYQIIKEEARDMGALYGRTADNISTISNSQQSTADVWRQASQHFDAASRTLAALTARLTGDSSYIGAIQRIPPPSAPSAPLWQSAPTTRPKQTFLSWLGQRLSKKQQHP